MSQSREMRAMLFLVDASLDFSHERKWVANGVNWCSTVHCVYKEAGWGSDIITAKLYFALSISGVLVFISVIWSVTFPVTLPHFIFKIVDNALLLLIWTPLLRNLCPNDSSIVDPERWVPSIDNRLSNPYSTRSNCTPLSSVSMRTVR